MTVKRAAIGGFIAGLASSTAYLAAGGDTFLSIPPWAEILFFTAVFVGTWTHFTFGPEYNVPEIVGCLTVAITYALVFGLAFAAYLRLQARLIHGQSKSAALETALAEDESESTDPEQR
jgi:hypothetical protein